MLFGEVTNTVGTDAKQSVKTIGFAVKLTVNVVVKSTTVLAATLFEAVPHCISVPSAHFWYPLALCADSGNSVSVPSLNLMLFVAI